MELVRCDDARGFLARARAFLERAPVMNSLMLGVSHAVAEQEHPIEPCFVIGVSEDGGVAICATQTPPRNLILSTGSADAIVPLVRWLRAEGISPPGVIGPAELAERFASAWADDESELAMAQRIYRCREIVEPPACDGDARVAEARDLDTITAWTVAFHDEAATPISEQDAAATVRSLIDASRLFVWERAGELVSCAAARNPNGDTVSITYVYTPPAERRSGYASNVTAAITNAMFARGFVTCVLYTDLANPTSNAIYQRIGYEAVGDSAVWTWRA